MTATFQIIESDTEGYRPYGAAESFWKYKGHEAIMAGPAETGKTRATLEKLDALMWKYPGAQAVIVRKIQATLVSTVLQTWRKKVVSSQVKVRGGDKPEWFDYPNKSRVWVAGIDNPGKALSSERDFIYVNQAEELLLEDWETLLTRATGRAGNAPYAQVSGDCNPGAPNHWIKKRESAGRLKLFESRHEDNPVLFNQETKEITEQGQRSLEILNGLTGVRLQRLRYGKWVSAEGAVYETYDAAIHLRDPFTIPADWRRIRVIDFGFTNPFVCQWWAISPDGAMYRYRELYGTRKIVDEWSRDIARLSAGEAIEATIADHDAEDRATLEKAGIYSIPARKNISAGIQAVQKRMRRDLPRIFLVRNSLVNQDQDLVDNKKPTCTEEEIEAYVWPKGADGKPNKEVPVKENDHGCDAMRYGVAYIDRAGEEDCLDFSIASPKEEPKVKGDPVPRKVEFLQEVGWQ